MFSKTMHTLKTAYKNYHCMSVASYHLYSLAIIVRLNVAIGIWTYWTKALVKVGCHY